MANVRYDNLKMQSYLSSSELKLEEKRTIFKYRTRMAQFGENYRGGARTVPCPLCNTHPDSQEISFKCPIIRKEVEIKGNYNDIFEEDIESNTIQTVLEIENYRKLKREKY